MYYDPNSFTVIVTYGNAWPNTRWASGIKTLRDARILRQGAKDRKFYDAEVWLEKDFQAFLNEKARSQANQGRADSQRR